MHICYSYIAESVLKTSLVHILRKSKTHYASIDILSRIMLIYIFSFAAEVTHVTTSGFELKVTRTDVVANTHGWGQSPELVAVLSSGIFQWCLYN